MDIAEECHALGWRQVLQYQSSEAYPLIMLEFLLAAAATSAAAGTLEAPPGVTIRYYDVAGTSLPAINASIAANSPRDRAFNAVSVSSSEWNISVRFDQKITDGRCEITAADARFTASLSLPRLVNSEALPQEQRRVWDQYVSNLRSYESAKLKFVHDRIEGIEAAIMKSSCENASQAAAAASARIEQELTSFARINKKPAPAFEVPVRDPNDPRG